MTKDYIKCCRKIIPLCKILCIYFPKGGDKQVPIGNNTITFFYGSTELDTVEQNPTEQDYIDSVDDVFLLGNEFSDRIEHNSNIEVNDFFNSGMKVLFIQVPKSEPVFTLWSEEGNPLQQNQQIESSFTNNSVLFRIDFNNSYTLYVTRSQTDFVGRIKLSR